MLSHLPPGRRMRAAIPVSSVASKEGSSRVCSTGEGDEKSAGRRRRCVVFGARLANRFGTRLPNYPLPDLWVACNRTCTFGSQPCLRLLVRRRVKYLDEH